MQENVTAILWVLLSTFLWTLIFAAAKFFDGGIGVFQLSLFRYLGGMATLLILVPGNGGLRSLRSNQPWVHLVRAVCGCGAVVAITWASANMPLVDATAIGLTYGILALLLGAFVLKETISRRHWNAVLVSLAGVALVMTSKGAFNSELNLLPALAALLGAALFALEGLLISLLGRSEHALTVMLYVTFFGFCLMLPPAVLEWRCVGATTITWALLLGPLAIFGQYCTIRGYRAAPMSVVAPVDYSWLLFSAILGMLFFNEIPGPGTWIGCAIIILGGFLLAQAGKD